ncbi:hypothetical protein [Flavobacterium sp. N2270]|uniref:hypothetical protein n=1 Tax=Flavobacterium sp. N2270 TaxID=2986831 RepID=UPI0022255EDF|nr:hypothetical protein [Flavobacterium sp. N2270]
MKIIITQLFFFITIGVYSQETSLLDSVLGQLNLKKSKIKTELVVFKSFPNNLNETIIVIPEIVDEGEMYFELNSHILIIDSKSGNIKSYFFESSKTNNWISDAIQLTEITIDTAPYKVSKNERAFGIRLHFIGSSRPNPYENEIISLFVQSKNKLKKILNNYEISYNGGEWDTNCEGKFVDERKVLIISNNKTNGLFDILVKNKISETTNYINENGECNYIEKNKTKKKSLKFNGYEYK